ncbi:MAG TPA: hypothetical protein VJN48_12830 [Terriglobales bacterium]|nr:hypothetical protein [Terriglobales bacterium]
MPAQVELEDEVEAVLEEQERHALERRERNSLAIAEVVGRNPARKPADVEPFSSTARAQLRIQRN